MKALILKELKSVFCSPAGAFSALAFLLIMGAMLWGFSGKYNFIDNGYANMSLFFGIAPMILAIVIPALTMRLFSEEKRNKTFQILKARPISLIAIYFSKFLASFIFIVIVILSTAIYVFSLSELSNPKGNIDLECIIISYLSLILLSAVFISIGLFSSSLTKNQIVALIISIILCFFTFYGFDLLAGFFQSGKYRNQLSSLGLFYHYKNMQRGVVQINNIQTIFNYLLTFIAASLIYLSFPQRRILINYILTISILNIFIYFLPIIQFDFTADKRYTISDYSKKILEQVDDKSPIEVNVYLEGGLNAGFQYLQSATKDILSDFNKYANNNILVKYINPYQNANSNNVLYKRLYDRGMSGITLNEVDREGKVSRKIIYPYAEITNSKDTLVVSLLKNISGNNAEENLNASIESLEFEFIDAIKLLQQQEEKAIAFIDGHRELPRTYVYDAEEALSKYYSINRGEIGTDVSVLNQFDAIIIAGPLSSYTEAEKYIIDQYIMNGGKVMWLIDGVYYSHSDLAAKGESASMKNDVNLDDLLFNYGVRINPDLIQDAQCLSTYLIADDNMQSSSLVPSYFQPLLMPSPDHPVTKDIKDIKASFVSSIDIVNNTSDVKKKILLTSSANTHLVKVPDIIDFDTERIQNTPHYFDQQFLPVAVSLEGHFGSAFQHRAIPDSVTTIDTQRLDESKNTRMIVISSADIISNEIQGKGEKTEVLPMGYDRVSQQQYGNRDFIVNAVNWLTDDDGLMALRTKQQRLYVLNKKRAFETRDGYAVLNIGIPILFMALIIGGTFIYRKRKYSK